MDQVAFHYDSERARKARIARKLEGLWFILLAVAAVGLLSAGLALLAYGYSFGWVIGGLSGLPAMIVGWYNGELKRLSPAISPSSIDDVISRDILGLLPVNPSPRDLAGIAGMTSGCLFFAARFGITPSILFHSTSENKSETPAVWHEAWSIMQKTGADTIDGGILLCALMRWAPDHEMLLAGLHLRYDDLMKGVLWQRHIHQLIERHEKPKRNGGIGRDLSFGYIPVLSRYSQNISEQIGRGGLIEADLEAHADALDQMIKTFSTTGRQNVALVGQQGSGKTSIVHAFAERLLDARYPVPDTIKYSQVFVLDASALLADATGRGELEKNVRQVLGEAYAAKNVIVCLESAELFFEEAVGSVDLTNILLPILEAGRLRIILTIDGQKYLKIGARNAALVNALNRITVGAATEEETLAVMQDQLIRIEFQYKVTFTYQSLLESYRLSERYVYDLAQPGRAMKLLESAARYAEGGLVTVASVHHAIEKTLGVKVGIADGESERDTLLNLESLIHKRMVNQSRAVAVVSDALRRARAGVRNQSRPIGTFLFMGPTGVGKTELSKALAGVYFGGEDRMIRIDLNEFVRPDDVSRLIADGSKDASSLTARVMKQPFSVVLFDEIEKAHPSVLATLLQLLDEGILRDIKNREVSFRDTIIIATSNAGADRIREYIERGYKLEQFEKHFIDELINTGQFRPEFLNRFDEIVIFRPLEKPELLQVVDIVLDGINKTLAPQNISVAVDEKAKAVLVDKGYDPRLGARPLRRTIQRSVENTVAKMMLSGNIIPGSTLMITLEEVEKALGKNNEAPA